MDKASRYSSTDHDSWTPLDGCPTCNDPEPNVRTAHHLDLARIGGVDTVRAHLTDAWVKQRERDKQRPDLVDDVCRWAAGVIEQFSGFPDDATGATMPWWQARDMMMQSRQKLATEAYAKAPEQYRARAEGRPVPGFHRARMTTKGTFKVDSQPPAIPYDDPRETMREPGEDDID